MRELRFIVAATLLVVVTQRAKAGPIITGGTESATTTYFNRDYMQGFSFFSNTNQTLTALGFWDSLGDGLPRAFQVGLWDTTTQALLASAMIDNSDPLDGSVTVAGGQWRYETLLTPVNLLSGNSYTLGWQAGVADLSAADSLLLNYPTTTFAPTVTVPQQYRFLETSAFVFPSVTSSPSNPRGDLSRSMVNAQLGPAENTSVTPEPTSLALAGFAGIGMAVGAWRRRRHAKALPA